MQSFNEFLLVENNEEIGFIRSFMSNLRQFDKTALLVFADWLADRGDWREEILRNAVEDRGPGIVRKNAKIAKENKFERFKSGALTAEEKNSIGVGRTKDVYAIYMPSAPHVLYQPSDDEWFVKDGRWLEEITVNEVPDEILAKFFWAILVYGHFSE